MILSKRVGVKNRAFILNKCATWLLVIKCWFYYYIYICQDASVLMGINCQYCGKRETEAAEKDQWAPEVADVGT